MSATSEETLISAVRAVFPAVEVRDGLPSPLGPWDAAAAAALDETSPWAAPLESSLVVRLPQEGYTLTPLRGGDTEHADLARVVGHPMVYPTLRSPPVPYTTDHAAVWCTLVRRRQLQALVPLFAPARSVGPHACPGVSPLGAIRHGDRLVGTVVLHARQRDTPLAQTTWEIGA